MLLSILTPTYNCVATLPQTLESVRALQRAFPGQIQHLIGDAGSTDGSLALLQQHVAITEAAALHVLTGMNIPTTLNVLLVHATGRWIAVLNGDDYFEVAALTTLLRSTRANTAAILCGQVSVWSADGEYRGFRDCRIDQLDRYMSVNHPALLVPRQLFDTIGRFDANAPTAYDYLWVWRAFRAQVVFQKVPTIFAAARLGGISQSRAYQAAKEVLQLKMKAGATAAALRNHAMFLLKSGVRKLLPQRIIYLMTNGYRKVKGSIEHY